MEETLPQVDPEQLGPLMLQLAALLVVPEIVVRNCSCSPTEIIASVGEMVTEMGTMIVTVAEADV